MGKQNPKAGAQQLNQQVAQQQAADQEKTASASTAEQSQQGPESAAPKSDAVTAPQAPQGQSDIVVQPEAPQAPAAPALARAVVVEAAKPVAANAAQKESLESILKDVPSTNRTDIARIQDYLVKMAPKRPVDTKAGVQEQVALYRSLQNIINRQEEFFTQLFSAVLFLFKTEGKDGALSDRYRMRFMDNITLHEGDRKAFAALTTMLHITADPASRELAMRQVNMGKSLENGLTAEGRMRVLQYFGL